jgi:predicted  nucleic acid-binding Zn-ribbon protein
MASNDDIMHAIGKLEGSLTGIHDSVAQIRKDVSDEKANAHESRAVVHKRLDDQAKQISHLDTTVAITGGVDAQIREEIKALKETVDRNHDAVTPALEEWKRLKTLGVGISGLIALAGLTVGGTISYAGDGAVAWLRHWLKLN